MIRRGMTLVELLIGVVVFSMLTFGSVGLFLMGLKQARVTSTDVDLTQSNSQGIRKVTESLREGMGFTISNDGYRIDFTVPQYATTEDPITGEYEYAVPLTADSGTHAFTVANGNLIDEAENRILVRNIVSVDPDPTSSQYNQTYPPFQATTIGSKRAVSVNLITRQDVAGTKRYVRMKNTVILRNGQ